MALIARVKDYDPTSVKFSYKKENSYLFPYKGSKLGGLYVNCEAFESNVHIIFQQYQLGQAPVRLINHSKEHEMEYWQE